MNRLDLAPVRAWLRRAAWREDRRGWGLLALLVVFLAHGYRYATWQVKDAHTYSDGYYSWLFARSLAFDFDVDLTNDYALCGDPFHLGVDEGGGRPANPFYFGPALFIGPILWVVKHLTTFGSLASASWRNGCTGPLIAYTGAASVFATTITIWIAYRIARRWYGEGPCAIAVLVMGLASPLNIFGTLTWYYSHLWAALAVAIGRGCALRASERPELGRRWLVAGLTCGLAALMRMQEGLWILVPIAAIAAAGLRAARDGEGDKAAIASAARRVALVVVGFTVVFAVQLYVFNRLYGSPFVVPQGKLYVQLSHAHPWLLLFGARSGLLYWTPLMWLSVLGIPWFLRRGPQRAIAIAIVVAGCASFFVASAALSWTGSATLGARVQTSLVPALLVPAAACLDAIMRWASRHRAATGAAVLLFFGPWIVTGWNAAASGVPNDRPVAAPQLYGSGVTYSLTQVYENVGNPWTLPAGAVFYARYRAHPRVLDALASEGMFQKHYRTLALMGADTLSFAHPPSTYWSEGIVPLGGVDVGVPAHGSARFLVTLYWPWVTSVRVTARPLDGPATLTIRSGSFFRRRAVGEATFARQETLEIPVPSGAFDSGINEVLLSSDAPIALDSWQWVDVAPHDTTTRLFKEK